MSVFMDLNVSYTTDKSRLRRLVEAAAHRESSARFGPSDPPSGRLRPARREASAANAANAANSPPARLLPVRPSAASLTCPLL